MDTRDESGVRDLHTAAAAEALGIDYTEAERRLRAGDLDVARARSDHKIRTFHERFATPHTRLREFAKTPDAEALVAEHRRLFPELWP